MAEPASALGKARFDGFAAIREIGPVGMISLRARPDLPGLAELRAAGLLESRPNADGATADMFQKIEEDEEGADIPADDLFEDE